MCIYIYIISYVCKWIVGGFKISSILIQKLTLIVVSLPWLRRQKQTDTAKQWIPDMYQVPKLWWELDQGHLPATFWDATTLSLGWFFLERSNGTGFWPTGTPGANPSEHRPGEENLDAVQGLVNVRVVGFYHPRELTVWLSNEPIFSGNSSPNPRLMTTPLNNL